ncbi:MAG: 4Fe-4S dicluster domain-containing protein [Anaerolineae bacterium]
MGIFIQVEIDPVLCSPDRGRKLVSICPVNVFTLDQDRVITDPENEDECTLCGLCLNLYPPGAVTVRRLYRE